MGGESSEKSVLHNVQTLRAVAALVVVCKHMTPVFDWAGIPIPQGGVDLFFAISGFIMLHVARDAKPRDFVWRRVARVVPAYWVMTMATFVVVMVAPSLFKSTSATLYDLFRSLAFIPFSKGAATQPILFVGWTLNYEMFFYALFALGLAWGGVRLVFTCLIGFVLAGYVLQPTSVIGQFYTSPLILEFGFGMVIALAYRRWDVPSGILAAIALVSLIGMLGGAIWFPSLNPTYASGVPAAIFLYCALELERKGYVPSKRIGGALGDASYAVYLTHPFVTAAAMAAWSRAPHNVFIALTLAIGTFMVVCAVGMIFYRLIERPATKYLVTRFQ